MDANTNPKNIGNVIEGVRAYILDDNQMQAEEGELYLAGVAVTCGYKNNTQSTQAKFLKLPHLDSSEIYRTGDIVKLNTHKEIIFMGRSDRQVKIRGYRVELEEIEGAFLAAGCKEVAVIQSKELALIAYVVIDETIGLEMLKVELTNRLSSYKLPKHIIKLESLPYKNNCKVDYQALPDVLKPGAGEIKYEALSGAHELIAKLWSEVLSINIELLNHQSNFRTLGGDSINIAMLLAGVEEKFGVVVDYVDFFDNPTIGFLFEIVKNKESELC
jgi:acyl carrier protein